MFEQSLVESTHVIKTQNRWSVWVSIAIQAAIAAVIVIVPLMHPESIGHLSFTAPTLVLPVPPPPPPPPVQVVAHMSSEPMSAPAAAAPQAARLLPATFRTAVESFMKPQADGDGPPGPPTNLPNGMGVGTTGTSLLTTNPNGPNVAVARPSIVQLSTGVTAGMLIQPIRPVYSAIARAARQQGTVTIHAIISKSGNIESATVVGGPSMLQGSALEAVKAARYRPYLLNGQPTEVDTTIIINFRLDE